MKRFRWAILPILLCCSVWLLFHTVLFVGIVPSSSMEPTIPEGNIILGTRVVGSLGRGDIIVFRHEGETLVKRIVAVGGDTVSLNDQDGSFAVNQELATATRILGGTFCGCEMGIGSCENLSQIGVQRKHLLI